MKLHEICCWIILLVAFVSGQEIKIGPWQQIIYSGSVVGRYQHASTFIPSTKELLLVGGTLSDTVSLTSDFSSLNFTSMSVRQISSMTPLGARGAMAYVSHPVSGDLYIHGGSLFPSNGRVNDFKRFNAFNRQWVSLPTTAGPDARNSHCLEFDRSRNRIILFGGYGSTAEGYGYASNDLWTFHLSYRNWTKEITSTATIPEVRYNHACTFDTLTNQFFTHGGQWSLTFYKDLWSFNFTSNRWTRDNIGNKNVQLYAHIIKFSASLNSLFLLFGVNDVSSPPLNPYIYQYAFRNQSLGWQIVQVPGPRITERYYASHAMNAQTGELYVSGGLFTFTEVWKIKIDNFPITVSSSRTTFTTAVNGITTPVLAKLNTSHPDTSLTVTVSSGQLSPRNFTNPSGSLQTSGGSEIMNFSSIISIYRYYFISGGIAILFVVAPIYYICRTRAHGQPEPGAKSKQATQLNHMSLDTSFNSSVFTSNASPSTQSATSSNNSAFLATKVPSEPGLYAPAYLQIDPAKEIRIDSVLSEGGFGVVYLADALSEKLKKYGPIVIVKQLKKHNVSNQDLNLFMQEVSLMEYFKDKTNIAKVLGYAAEPKLCLVMKYYPFGSLRKWLTSASQRSKVHVVAFGRDIVLGLQAMNSKGVLHNDLKPDNVLIDQNPQGQYFCVLADLGISQVVTEQLVKVNQFQVTQIRALSMAYAAPERILYFREVLASGGNDCSIFFTWDLYSLGIVLFELLNGSKRKLYK